MIEMCRVEYVVYLVDLLCLGGRSPEAYGSCRVCVSVCVCVCVCLSRAFLCNG